MEYSEGSQTRMRNWHRLLICWYLWALKELHLLISLVCSMSSVCTVTAIATNHSHLLIYLHAALDNWFLKLCFLFFAKLLGLAGNHRDGAEEGRKTYSSHIITKCRKFLKEIINEKIKIKPFQLWKNRCTNKNGLICVCQSVWFWSKSSFAFSTHSSSGSESCPGWTPALLTLVYICFGRILLSW